MSNHPNRSRKFYVHCIRHHMKSQTFRDSYEVIEADENGAVPAGQTNLSHNPRGSWTSSNQGPFTRSEAKTRLAELIAQRDRDVAAQR